MPYAEGGRGAHRTTRRCCATRSPRRACTVPADARDRRRRLPPAPQLKFADVPDLHRDHRACPRTRCATSSRASAGRRARRRRAWRPASGAARDVAFYTSWLAALKSLDFDKLSRNAQVDYLFIRRTAETQIARANLKLDPNPPRKTGRERHSGPGARPRRAHPGPVGSDDSVHAGRADRARREGIRLVRPGDAEGLARDGFRQRLEEGDREDEGHRRAARRPAADDHGSARRGGRLPAREQPDHRAAGRRRVAAHDHDDAASASW